MGYFGIVGELHTSKIIEACKSCIGFLDVEIITVSSKGFTFKRNPFFPNTRELLIEEKEETSPLRIIIKE